MPYVVTQACCADASCVVACPVNCIHPTPGEPGFAEAEMLYVDGTSCVDCGACASACPVDAVKPHTALSEAEQPFVAINAAYYDCFPHVDRSPLAPVAAQRRLRRRGPFRVAVVGAGPAGLYTADELLKHPEVSVDVLDRLPTPYGLVRAGVAPDHPHTKRVERLFAAIEDQPGFRYCLGVEVGRDVTLAELEQRYDAVVYCVGAAADRALGVEGEQLRGSLSATEVVAWYNGHPDARHLDVPLDHDRAVVVGNGNVALDVARVLARPAADLVATDVAPHALGVLADSRLREVVVLGRRGPAQAAFTVPELVGLVALADSGLVDVVVQAPPGVLDAPPTGTGDPADHHRLRLLAGLATRPRTPGRRAVVLRFCSRPVRLLDDGSGRVGAVEVERTRLVTTAAGDVVAEPTGEREVLACGLVLRSVGYRGRPVADLPHDPVAGTVPHERGRVRPGLYVAGWVKRGARGFIGTNKTDAEETVASLLDDLDAGLGGPGARRAVPAPMSSRALDLRDWRALDREERRRGGARGAPREKVVDPDEAVAVALAARARPGVRSRLRLTTDPARGSGRRG